MRSQKDWSCRLIAYVGEELKSALQEHVQDTKLKENFVFLQSKLNLSHNNAIRRLETEFTEMAAKQRQVLRSSLC